MLYRENPPTIKLERELIFCNCDLNDENFMFSIDSAGRLRLYVIDFECASFLPPSMFSVALFDDSREWITGEPLIKRIGHTLPTGNIEALQAAAYLFSVSGPNIGFPLVRAKPIPEPERPDPLVSENAQRLVDERLSARQWGRAHHERWLSKPGLRGRAGFTIVCLGFCADRRPLEDNVEVLFPRPVIFTHSSCFYSTRAVLEGCKEVKHDIHLYHEQRQGERQGQREGQRQEQRRGQGQ